MPLLSDAWYIIIHFVLPLGLIVGVLGYVGAHIWGTKASAARFRSMIFSVPLALAMVSAAILVSNWIISTYAV